MKPKPKPPKGGYKHIIMPEPTTVPFMDDDSESDLPVYDADGQELEYGIDYGTCDADGCLVMYDPGSNDHCPEEGKCWSHCADPVNHGYPYVLTDKQIMISKLVAEAEAKGVVPTFASPYPGEPLPGNPLLIGDALISKAGPAPSTITYINQAVLEGNPQDVFEYSKDLLDKSLNAPTSADRIALFVSGIEAIARAEHAQVVAFSEGRSLAKHMSDYGDQGCGVCENLKKYSEFALELLKPIAIQQQEEIEEAKTEIMRVSLGVCVDCGKPSERQYSLEEGKGYMCARCAGPYLIMDDGLPGDPFEKED